ncbi:hypothetical protein BDN71DRAFT_1513363 [Pleurotus eryngii]|uniref:Uncharacterized protein n=1 Tax=Pleurotus eryngii TaxID=5323 RepID=A0A9P5ZJ10_PLEER|nr:hypothetical protein BDN71DRAFT_1513363 [Pleurotus eryngii]
MRDMQDKTGWCFSVLTGGCGPTGHVKTASYHLGKMKNGNTFAKAFTDFNDGIMKPWTSFVRNVCGEDPHLLGPLDSLSEANRLAPMLLPPMQLLPVLFGGEAAPLYQFENNNNPPAHVGTALPALGEDAICSTPPPAIDRDNTRRSTPPPAMLNSNDDGNPQGLVTPVQADSQGPLTEPPNNPTASADTGRAPREANSTDPAWLTGAITRLETTLGEDWQEAINTWISLEQDQSAISKAHGRPLVTPAHTELVTLARMIFDSQTSFASCPLVFLWTCIWLGPQDFR